MYKKRKEKRKKVRTDIEQILYLILLNDLSVKFKSEFKVGNYPVDFYLPNCKLSIQCDGNYFHGGCEKCNPKDIKTKRQFFQSHRDQACLTYHKYCKISLIRLCSCFIKSEKIAVVNYLKAVIKRVKSGELVYDFRSEGC